MMISLGAVTFAFATRPGDCPAGTRAEPIVYDLTGLTPVTYACVAGEPWLCEDFGGNCIGPEVAAPAAPRTPEQMRNPLAWTPRKSAEETAAQQRRNIDLWLKGTEGVAMLPAWLHETAEDAKKAISNPLLWAVVGAAAVVVLIVAAKR